MVADKYGFIDDNGNVVIDPQFDAALDFSEGLCAVKAGDRLGYINKHGDFVILIETNNTKINRFVEGRAEIVRDGKYGFIDTLGQEIIPCIYDAVSDFTNGFTIVKSKGKYGVINDNGDVVVDVRWNYLRDPVFEVPEKENNWGWVVTDSINGRVRYGLVDSNGEMVIPCEYDDIDWFYNDYIRVCKDKKCGLLDKNGKVFITMVYDGLASMSNRLFLFQNDTCWMLNINKKDTICIIKPEWIKELYYEKNGMFFIGDEKMGLIDSNGNIVIEPIYDEIKDFENGKAAFKKNGRWGIMDLNGDIIIKSKFDYLRTRKDGLFVFGNKSGNYSWTYGLLDTCGNTIIPAKYSKIYDDTLQLVTCEEIINDVVCRAYYDRSGKLIWQDIPPAKKYQPERFNKEDWIDFFKSNIASLDPIEGLYFFEQNFSYYVNRINPNINGVSDDFIVTGMMAIVKENKNNKNRYITYLLNNTGNINKDKSGSDAYIMYFNKLGDPQKYMVESNDYSLLSLNNPYQFELFLNKRSQDIFDYYERYAFVKEYPTMSDNEQERQPDWSGTGFAIADGLIATNYHVVNGAKNIRIKGVDGGMETAYNGYVLASDEEHDIAIIKIVDKKFKGFDKIPYCIGKSIADVGEDVFVLGYPLTTTMGNDVKLTNGIISSTSGFQGNESMYQISVPVQPGNSGGPLFDDDGNVVGIVTAKHADAENANYAVKINYLASLISNKNLDIKLADNNKIKGKSLKKKVKAVKNFVYLIECSN